MDDREGDFYHSCEVERAHDSDSDRFKHKFKVGDVGYFASSNYDNEISITRVQIHEIKANDVCVWGPDADWFVGLEELHPTPEACAQALVDEFYLNNPKT